MLDFSEEETDALARLLSRQSTTIVSPRIQISKAISASSGRNRRTILCRL
jgi:hypothetical protein